MTESTSNANGLNFQLTDAQLEAIRAVGAAQIGAWAENDCLESFTLNVQFSFCALGREVTCCVGSGKPVVIDSDW